MNNTIGAGKELGWLQTILVLLGLKKVDFIDLDKVDDLDKVEGIDEIEDLDKFFTPVRIRMTANSFYVVDPLEIVDHSKARRQIRQMHKFFQNKRRRQSSGEIQQERKADLALQGGPGHEARQPAGKG